MDRQWLLRAAYPWARRYWQVRRPLTLGARALVIAQGDMLLVRHAYGDEDEWTMPGGSVQRGETVVATALRELSEECGLSGQPDPDPLLGVYYDTDEGKHDHVAVVVCQVTHQPPHPGYPEIAEAAWHPLAGLPRLSPLVVPCLEAYAGGRRGQCAEW